ncbi:MAG: arginine deiminase-related protein, partial [Caulobacterales bacterium]
MPLFLMTDPSCFDVSYQINPWMRPTAWRPEHAAAAKAASAKLKAALKALGAEVETIEAIRGLPDLVFPANAAVVLDGRVLLARFRYPERQGEEAVFRAVFSRLRARGLVHDIVDLPDGVLQEGAGDCIWDTDRRLFWAGYGPRSSKASVGVIGRTFGQRAEAGVEVVEPVRGQLQADHLLAEAAGDHAHRGLAGARAETGPEQPPIGIPDAVAGAFLQHAVRQVDDVAHQAAGLQPREHRAEHGLLALALRIAEAGQ